MVNSSVWCCLAGSAAQNVSTDYLHYDFPNLHCCLTCGDDNGDDDGVQK